MSRGRGRPKGPPLPPGTCARCRKRRARADRTRCTECAFYDAAEAFDRAERRSKEAFAKALGELTLAMVEGIVRPADGD